MHLFMTHTITHNGMLDMLLLSWKLLSSHIALYSPFLTIQVLNQVYVLSHNNPIWTYVDIDGEVFLLCKNGIYTVLSFFFSFFQLQLIEIPLILYNLVYWLYFLILCILDTVAFGTLILVSLPLPGLSVSLLGVSLWYTNQPI